MIEIFQIQCWAKKWDNTSSGVWSHTPWSLIHYTYYKKQGNESCSQVWRAAFKQLIGCTRLGRLSLADLSTGQTCSIVGIWTAWIHILSVESFTWHFFLELLITEKKSDFFIHLMNGLVQRIQTTQTGTSQLNHNGLSVLSNWVKTCQVIVLKSKLKIIISYYVFICLLLPQFLNMSLLIILTELTEIIMKHNYAWMESIWQDSTHTPENKTILTRQ